MIDSLRHGVVVACILLLLGATIGSTFASDPQRKTVSESKVESAIEASRGNLLTESSRVNDHWASNVSVGPNGTTDLRLTIYYALTLERVDADPEHKRQAIKYILSQRSPDGGWNDTTTNYGGLLLLRSVDEKKYHEQIKEIERAINRKNMSLTESSNASTDSALFRIKLFYAVMSDRYSTAELFPQRAHVRLPQVLYLTPAFENEFDPNASAINPYAVDWMLSTAILGQTIEKNASSNVTKTMTKVLLARRLSNGTWKGTLDNIFAVLALHEAGYTTKDEELTQPIEWIGSQRITSNGRLLAYRLPVWDTAWTMRSLSASGVSKNNETMREAAQWLYQARTAPHLISHEQTLARPPVTFREHSGDGWGYRPAMYSDWDDTAAAITALSPYADTLVSEDTEFLFRTQNSNGSWSAFVTDFDPLSDNESRRVRRAVGNSTYSAIFVDHPAPGVTGHTLEAVGQQGYTIKNNKSVNRAVSYLFTRQAENGLWMGVWGEGYTYGTSRVLLGMDAVGVDLSRPEVQKAAQALINHQNSDGGWGEQSAYQVTGEEQPYETAPSTPAQTAWALQALLTAGISPDHPAVQQAVQYLLETQRVDGSWKANRVMANMGPPLYESPIITQASALRALSMYADAQNISVASNTTTTGFLTGGDEETRRAAMVLGLFWIAIVSIVIVQRKRPFIT